MIFYLGTSKEHIISLNFTISWFHLKWKQKGEGTLGYIRHGFSAFVTRRMTRRLSHGFARRQDKQDFGDEREMH